MRTGADRYRQLCLLVVIPRADILQTGADRGGQVRKSLVSVCPQLADIGWTGADRCGQVWFLGVSHSWRTFRGQVRTGADNSGSCVSFLVDGHLVDRCGQVQTTLVPGCHS